MKALPWLYLALLSLGYGWALSYGHLGWLALISIGLPRHAEQRPAG